VKKEKEKHARQLRIIGGLPQKNFGEMLDKGLKYL
jgi:hypothetical protein